MQVGRFFMPGRRRVQVNAGGTPLAVQAAGTVDITKIGARRALERTQLLAKNTLKSRRFPCNGTSKSLPFAPF
jgi:hypothetical protein